ncbi:MAG: zinc dependent phospholipase C family protein [Oscillospiraceae bacterium]|nr:zinc dependent phospholipase C family protein [Oscillospiraceae bacterium]
MPASLEHLLAGRRAAELLRPEELPQYYLGCIAPDAPNLDGFASKEVRWSAHLRRPEPEEWIRHALKWLMKEGKPSSLRLGYAVHVVGDAVWDAHFEKKLQKAVDAAALSREERFRCRWDEHYRFEQEQLQADWWLQEVRPLLAQAVPQAINGLPETLIGRFRDDLISSYAPAPEGKTVGFVTAERVAAFGQQLCEALQPLLKQLG